MKAILMSILPKWCGKIISGKKTIEIRKTKPKIKVPFKCYIYATKNKKEIIGRITSYGFLNGISIEIGKVIGEFICDRIDTYLKGNSIPEHIKEKLYKESCLSCKEIYNYVTDKTFYTWHISQLKIYDKPKELSEFSYIAKKAVYGNSTAQKPFMYVEQSKNLTRPPQSWCYVEKLE